jgi:SNF2 family DNA or RNA helicase
MKDKTASMAKNEFGERVIRIVFPYDLDELKRIRELPGRKYHPEDRCWSAPIQAQTLETLIKWGYDLDDKLNLFLKRIKNRAEKIATIGIPELNGTLYPFQNKGVAFIESHKGRALIADEMGLGKTIQALAWLQLHTEKRPAIIIVPASLKLNWQREAETWMPDPRVEVLYGKTPWETDGEILIINYDVLPNDYETEISEKGRRRKKEIPGTGWIDSLIALNPQVIITDECHYYKNNSANRTLGIKKLSKGVPCFLALSGTPIENRPIEIYNAWKIIDPLGCPPWNHFVYQYCAARNNGFGLSIDGASNTEELHQKLSDTIMLRRLKKDVLPDLPDKVRSFVPIQLYNLQEYRAAEVNFIAFVKRTKGDEAADRASNAKAFAEIEGLKQLAVKGKLKESIEWISNFLNIDGKLVVFATHKFVIDALIEKFKDIAVKIDGSVTGVGRQKAVDDFQTNPNIHLFVGNIQAAGVGITLTAASNVAFLELPWTPGGLTQAEDRCHRIGQKDCVNIYYLLAKDTIEEKIANLLDRKRRVLDAVLDGEETEKASLLSELMKMYQ